MVSKGSFVRVTYTGRIKETGELFDTTDEATARQENAYSDRVRYGPVALVVGEGKLVRGLDEALLEMSVGEERTLDVPPEKAFGTRRAELVRLIPLQEFKRQGFVPHVGMAITMNNVRGRVLSVNSGRVRVDFNHPLAGKTLTYTVRVEEQIGSRDEKVRGIVDYYTRNVDVRIVNDEVEVIHTENISQRVKQAITDELKRYVGIAGVRFTQNMRPQTAETQPKSS